MRPDPAINRPRRHPLGELASRSLGHIVLGNVLFVAGVVGFMFVLSYPQLLFGLVAGVLSRPAHQRLTSWLTRQRPTLESLGTVTHPPHRTDGRPRSSHRSP